MKKYPKVELPVHSHWHDEQCFVNGEEAWLVQTLWEAAEDLPAYEVPLIGIPTDIEPWDDLDQGYLGYLAHVKLIMEADLDYPIILTPNGVIADGRHRLGRAIVEGRTTIKIKRLKYMPDPDFVYDEDGNPVEGDE